MEKFDLAVIGAGPGGYVAAIRAAQKGLKVVCIEKKKRLGGTCLNVGCIPSKALLHSTEYYHRIIEDGKKHGIEASQLNINFARMMERKDEIVTDLANSIDFLFRKNKITRLQGEARLLSPTSIQMGNETIETNYVILATGSEPISLPFLPFDEKKIISSTGALFLSHVPKKMLVIGAGVIGLELGSVYRRLGAKIEVVELFNCVIPNVDKEISKSVEQILQKQGFKFYLNRKVTAGTIIEEQVSLTLNSGEEVNADVVLVAIGRSPYSKGLGLDEIGVQKDSKGRILINHNFCTSISNIYAIGDLVDGPMLAHKASEEAVAAVDLILGKTTTVNYMAIPNVMYTWPEVACVGITEEEAYKFQLEILIGKVPFKAIPRAHCSGDEQGFVKIIGEKNTKKVIGLHIIGANASEMIHEGSLAIEKKMTLTEIAYTSHAHPTCSEAIKEAALAALGQAIHF